MQPLNMSITMSRPPRKVRMIFQSIYNAGKEWQTHSTLLFHEIHNFNYDLLTVAVKISMFSCAFFSLNTNK